MTLRIRGIVLPEREERSFRIDGEVLRLDQAMGGDTVVDGGWIIPGLVDAHTHPGAEQPGDAFSEEAFRRHLIDHRNSGTLAVRTPGTAARIPAWAADDPELPRIRSAGRWLTSPGRFFPGWGREVPEAELVEACLEEAATDGWCKVIGDWRYDDPALPFEVLSAATKAVHAAGGRVAVHCQTAEGCRNAVLAEVDSIEHGMHLDPELLDRMAAQGTALVPTLTVFGLHADEVRARDDSPMRDWWLSGWEGMLPLTRAAHEAGVAVYAGTDSVPLGTAADEVEWLARAGLPAEEALGAASWQAREWLGLPALVDGCPADLVVYDKDPTVDLDVLRRPSRVVLRGRIVQ